MTELEQNVAKLQGYLERFRQGGIQHRINGQAVASAQTFATSSPVDGSHICDVARGGAAFAAAAA